MILVWLLVRVLVLLAAVQVVVELRAGEQAGLVGEADREDGELDHHLACQLRPEGARQVHLVVAGLVGLEDGARTGAGEGVGYGTLLLVQSC